MIKYIEMGGKAALMLRIFMILAGFLFQLSNNGILAGRRRRGTKPSKISY